ncbi:MAG: HD domain-containing protein [Bacillus subtilis]|nr:HD domain-containing protein [Bacillus subtilis]
MQGPLIDKSSPEQAFVQLFQTHVKREGAEELLAYLRSSKSDFFTAPASTRFHLATRGGLATHSLNVYESLLDYLARDRVKSEYRLNPSPESVAIVALLHDVCKINVYQPTKKNVKKDGAWVQEDAYDYRDDLPYGHGEKSVYIITGFMRLTREESFAIRYHMGFSGNEEKTNVSASFEKFPLALALSIADMEASFLLESRN